MPYTTTEQAIKDLRVACDALKKQTEDIQTIINRGAGGREVALAITKLQEAKMWLGQALGELGSKLPEEFRDEAKPNQ